MYNYIIKRCIVSCLHYAIFWRYVKTVVSGSERLIDV